MRTKTNSDDQDTLYLTTIVGSDRDQWLAAPGDETLTEDGSLGEGYQYVLSEDNIEVKAVRTWRLVPARDSAGRHMKRQAANADRLRLSSIEDESPDFCDTCTGFYDCVEEDPNTGVEFTVAMKPWFKRSLDGAKCPDCEAPSHPGSCEGDE